MKKILFVIVATLLIAAIVQAQDIKPDVKGVFGTHFEASTEDAEGTQSITIERDRTEWYGTVEAGLTIEGTVRPFIGYTERHNLYNITEIGTDVFIPNLPVGVRVSFVKEDIEGVLTKKEGFVGVTFQYR